MALTRSRATTPTMVLPAPHAMSVTIPIRFQCPLCLDVLRRPIQLPCCQRHLCLECFKRALELTSVNCGFCRRRVVGFARTKQYKVDDTLWTAIQTTCPFLRRESNQDEREPLVDFFDEDAPPLHSDRNDAVSITDPKTSRELHAFYDRPLHSHDIEEQRALEQTLEFLQHDLEFTAALAATSSKSSSSRSFERLLTEKSCEPERTKDGSKVTTAVGTKRARTRSTVTFASDEKQSKLDYFFVASQAGSSHAEDTRQNQRGTCSTRAEAASPCGTTPVHAEIKEPTKTYFLRSASHSPRPTKKRRRRPVEGCKPLLQLKLDSTNSSVALHTRSRDPTLAHAVNSKPLASWRMLTRQRRRQSSWKCAQCTYTNTCFDKRCSMCRSLSRPETGASSHSSQ